MRALRRRAGLVLALSLAVCLAAATGCGTPAVGTPSQIIKKAVKAQSQVKSAHVEVEIDIDVVMPGGNRSAVVSYKGDYEQPDRWSLKVRSGDSRYEVIVIGDRVYLKLPGAETWTDKSGELAKEATTPGDVVGSKYLESAEDVKMVDRKGDTYHLQFDLDINTFVRSFELGGVDPSAYLGKKAKMDVWVQKDSLRIEKATMSFTGAFIEPSPGKLTMNMELEFSEVNEPVSIEPPI
ncbi:MAG: hypothetical protein KKF41_08890 [Actinobacteria bacterium]|nr:hypothetical protein [Actinomycetota bacterium]MBU1943867.1 hypothetical protein [Actinomycetota bacterium]MBU2687688.1 hypothetical protein [Actinomycetota bacterium]